MKEKKLAIIGSINTDFTFKCKTLPAPSETISGDAFEINFGGKGANEAVAAARLGAKVSLFGKVGFDMFSKANLAHLKKEKINTTAVEIEKETSGGSAGILVGSNTNSIIVVPGANKTVDKKYIDSHKKEILAHDVFCLQLEIPFDTSSYAIDMLSKANKTIIFNPSPITKLDSKLLNKCSYIIVNEVEIEQLPRFKSREQMLKDYKGKLILTCGGDGVFYFDKGQIQHVPALKVGKVVDTTGAGDTFLAAFGVALAENKNISAAITFANVCAGLKTKKFGAQQGMPLRKEVETYIKNNK